MKWPTKYRWWNRRIISDWDRARLDPPQPEHDDSPCRDHGYCSGGACYVRAKYMDLDVDIARELNELHGAIDDDIDLIEYTQVNSCWGCPWHWRLFEEDELHRDALEMQYGDIDSKYDRRGWKDEWD